MKIIVHGQKVYSKELGFLNNRQYKPIHHKYFYWFDKYLRNFFQKNPRSIETTIIGKSYLFIYHDDNLAHFFHDFFFPFYFQWRNDKKKIIVSLKKNIEFYKDFFSSLFQPNELIFIDPEKYYQLEDGIICDEGRDLKKFENYLLICNEIRDKIFENLKINPRRNQDILYGRNELVRKQLLEIDQNFLSQLQIKQHALSQLSFRELVFTLSSARTLILMVGAGVFYYLFLDKTTRVIEINPHENNSWAQMFGLAKNCQLYIFVSNNIKLSNHHAQANPLLDSNVIFDDKLKQFIANVIAA